MGPDAALCNGVYGSEGNRSSALLAREVCSFNIILYMEYEFAMYVSYFPMVQAANLSYQLDSCQSTIKSSCFNETENLTMILLDECWPMVEQLESSTESCLSRWIKILAVFFILVSSSACQARPRVALAGNLWRKLERSSSSDVWTPRRQVKLFTSFSILCPIFSSHRSSLRYGVLLYIQQHPTFWDFEHFCQYI